MDDDICRGQLLAYRQVATRVMTVRVSDLNAQEIEFDPLLLIGMSPSSEDHLAIALS